MFCWMFLKMFDPFRCSFFVLFFLIEVVDPLRWLVFLSFPLKIPQRGPLFDLFGSVVVCLCWRAGHDGFRLVLVSVSSWAAMNINTWSLELNLALLKR